MHNIGIYICDQFPNLTSMLSIMDEIFGALKFNSQNQTHNIHTGKIQYNSDIMRELDQKLVETFAAFDNPNCYQVSQTQVPVITSISS